MPIIALDRTANPNWLDGVRYQVPSRTDPHATYLCELTAYNGNGECDCQDFRARFGPLLSRMVTPEQALADGTVKLRDYQRPEHALMCRHLVDAHWKFEQEVLHRIIEQDRAQPGWRPD